VIQVICSVFMMYVCKSLLKAAGHLLKILFLIHRFSSTCFLDFDGQPTCDQCSEGYTGRNCDVLVDQVVLLIDLI